MIGEITEIVGKDFDTAYIVKILEKYNYDFERTVDALLDYKVKLEERKKKKETEVKKVVAAPKAPPAQPKQPIHKESTMGSHKDGPKKGDDESNPATMVEGYIRQNSRKLSKDEIKELPLDRKKWNTLYPIVKYGKLFY